MIAVNSLTAVMARHMHHNRLVLTRREPYLLYFPLAVLVGGLGTLPWLFLHGGHLTSWPGPFHAATMTQAFLLALIVGFLGTMLPRRTGVRPLSTTELTVVAAAIMTLPAALHLHRPWIAETAFLIALLTLAPWIARAVHRRADAPRSLPPSFVFLPLGMLLGALGTCLLLLAPLLAAAWPAPLGRLLAQQALLLCMVLAIAPVLAPNMTRISPLPDPTPAAAARLRFVHLLAGAALAVTFLLEVLVSVRLGLLSRAAICAAELLVLARIWEPGERPGLHRALFRLALWLVPIGIATAGLAPAQRTPLLHVAFVGGFGLLAFAVSVHVTLLHGGRAAQADRRPLAVAVGGALIVAAAATRMSAAHAPQHYFALITAAAALWLAAILVWTAFLAINLPRPRA